MKLLLITSEGEVDQILMVVPDDYKPREALEECDGLLQDPVIELAVDIDDNHAFSLYRPYTG